MRPFCMFSFPPKDCCGSKSKANLTYKQNISIFSFPTYPIQQTANLVKRQTTAFDEQRLVKIDLVEYFSENRTLLFSGVNKVLGSQQMR